MAKEQEQIMESDKPAHNRVATRVIILPVLHTVQVCSIGGEY